MLVLLRHGQSTLNRGGRLLGITNPSLSDLGASQAKLCGSLDKDAHTIISSPLSRAYQSATFAFPNRAISTDSRWTEINYGSYEGKKLSDIPPLDLEKWMSDPDFQPPSGESLQEVQRRVTQALDDLLELAASETVIVVSHVTPIKAAVAVALGVDMRISWHMRLSLSSATTLAATGNQYSLVGFNDVSHLGDLAIT